MSTQEAETESLAEARGLWPGLFCMLLAVMATVFVGRHMPVQTSRP